ncbi:uncharacterized protein FTJAE_3047 [Fusarium tjaetaba]|uniref:Uncharacterized protein n=1 Tax=Fusarium tjaetaba TaxID=1567544 RepID=A0A8H5S178_9HYPO|nr:uncharacterized protein FTJAE_3047 [Fusarium tjaetaba]KAF5643749.1 hypothetical protein FTJAE_3047 [Fusarium tjaetaba]
MDNRSVSGFARLHHCAFTEAVDPQVRQAHSRPAVSRQIPARGAHRAATACHEEIRELKEKLASAMEEIQFFRQQLDKFREP